LAKLGLPRQKSRRWLAELPWRQGSSHVVGAQKAGKSARETSLDVLENNLIGFKKRRIFAKCGEVLPPAGRDDEP
jgi:hypothetical protein